MAESVSAELVVEGAGSGRLRCSVVAGEQIGRPGHPGAGYVGASSTGVPGAGSASRAATRRGRAARLVAVAARAAAGSSCDASGRGPRSRRADHRCRLVRCGSPDCCTRVGTSPSWAGAVGRHTNSPPVASLTALVRRLERARAAPAVARELLGCSFLFELAWVSCRRVCGVTCQPS
jgi:hypothetical protein